MPPFHVTLPCHQPPGQPLLYPAMPPQLMLHEYGCQAWPAPFPPEHYIVKSGEPPMPGFIQTGQAGKMDGNRNFQPPSGGDVNSWRLNASHHGNRPHNGHEAGPHFNPRWHHQRAFGPRDNMNMPHGIVPGTFVRPFLPFLGPAPGLINRPGFPGILSTYGQFLLL